MTAKSSPLVRWTGVLLGVALAAGLVLAGRMPASGAAVPAHLEIASQPTAELGVAPAGRTFLEARRLTPGGPAARGSLTVSNYTTRSLVARLRLAGPGRELDRLVRVELSAGGETVYRGPLGGLRSWAAAGLRLRPGQKRRVEVRVLVPRSVDGGYEARAAELALEWRTGDDERG
ncbi:MAG: hypothetical protein ACRDL4_20370 [Thermoleophilaceae bacterium]